nr:metal-dependent hydrolase [Acidiferrimicrobium sp. IK]
MTSQTEMHQTRNPDRKVPTRRMSFEESLREVPKHFAGDGDLIGSHLTATLSSVFPDGEEFFVRSVRRFRDQITEPALKKQVAGFIGQESVHGREHRAFNDRLSELGYPTKRLERMTDRLLRFRERLLSPKSNLAVTAALEHFTAVLGEMVLSEEQVRHELGHPAVRDLFVWHAMEECEHKAVAFDVYRAVGGSERMRIGTMKVLRLLFIVYIGGNVTLSLLGDAATYKRGNLRASLRRFRTSPLSSPVLWQRLKEYDARGFHPDDHDTNALLEQWSNELFGPEGTLNDKLATAVA